MDWPPLSWNVPPRPLAWLSERVREMAVRARAFELALEEAAQTGDAPLSKAAEELEWWEHLAANVWMYFGMLEARQVPAEDVPAHAEELAKVYANLIEARAAILARLGQGAAKVLALEASAQVDDAEIRQRAGELPSFSEVNALGVEVPRPTFDGVEHPITPDEVQHRRAAESKPLPAGADLEACLAILPPPWVGEIFYTLGLELPPPEGEAVELTVNSRTVVQRRLIAEKLPRSAELLREVVFALEDEDRGFLAELIRSGGAASYAEARRRLGPDDADGFFWGERRPSGGLARLRRTGLCYVGMRDGTQVVAVPADLLGPLTALLG